MPYEWIIGDHTHICETAGTYRDTVLGANGCAATITILELTAKQQFRLDEDVEVAEQALPYAWTGHKLDTLLSTNGDYFDIREGANGECDSIYHIHFHVNFVERDTLRGSEATGCDSLVWRDSTYYVSGLVSDTVFTDEPANTQYDAIHYCDVTVHPSYLSVEPDTTFCQGLTFTWHGVEHNLPAGDTLMEHKLATAHGCDSIYQRLVHVTVSFHNEMSYTACPSELPYEWQGQLLTEEGTYTDAHISATGCDSIYTLHFSINTESLPAPIVTSQQICQEDTIDDWYGITIPANEPGEYTYYKWYTPAGACDAEKDSTYYQLNLTVTPTYHLDSVAEGHYCLGGSFPWFGIDRSVPLDAAHKVDEHTYVDTIYQDVPTAAGCDSLKATLTLYLHLPYDTVKLEDTIVCNTPVKTFDWDGLAITETGDYKKEYQLNGCQDSVVVRHFEVYNSDDYVLLPADTACDSLRWHGVYYTESDTLEYHVQQPGQNCDSVYYLPLTVYKTIRDTVSLDIWCPTFAWGGSGETYDQSGIYEGTHVLMPTRCDSIPYLRLTMHDSIVTHVTEQACDTFTWDVNNMTYTVSMISFNVSYLEMSGSVI